MGIKVTGAKEFRELACQFRKLGELSDKVADAYEKDGGDSEQLEAALKDFTWEFLKMQKM